MLHTGVSHNVFLWFSDDANVVNLVVHAVSGCGTGRRILWTTSPAACY